MFLLFAIKFMSFARYLATYIQYIYNIITLFIFIGIRKIFALIKHKQITFWLEVYVA